MKNIIRQKWWTGSYQFILVSLILVSMVAQSSPLFFYLDQYQKNPRPTLKQEITDKLINKAEAKENTSKKTANANFYETKDGKGYAKISLDPINYLNNNNQYVPIDNTITENSELKTDGYKYINKSNNFQIKFKENSKSDLFNLQLNGSQLDLSINGANNTQAQIKENVVTYSDILDGIDIRYTIDNDSVKEEIILKQKPNLDKLSFTLNASKDITVFEDSNSGLAFQKNNETIFRINPPFALNQQTLDPIYSKYIINQKNNVVSLDLPLANFISQNEYRYPIIIDPTINISNSADYENGYASECQPGYTHDTSYIYVGNAWCDASSGTTAARGEGRGFLKFNLSGIPTNSQIDSAVFGIAQERENTNANRIKLYQVTSPWQQLDTPGYSNGLRWDNQPSIDTNSITSYTGNTQWSWWNYDITSLVKKWTTSSSNPTYAPNHGLTLRATDPTLSKKAFISKSYVGTTAYKPYLLVYYNNNANKNLIGDASYWQYSSMPYADGTIKANLASGNLVASFQDLTTKSLGQDISISHTYNSQDTYDGPFGYNWTITPNQRLSFPLSNLQTIVFSDTSNTQYTFFDHDNDYNYVDPNESETGKADNLDGSSSFYTRAGHRPNGLFAGMKYDPNTQKYTMTYSGGSKLIFDQSGKLVQQLDKNNNAINYTYLDGKLIEIINSANKKIILNYNNIGRLESITDLNYNDPNYHSYGLKISYTYTNTDLTSVSYHNGDTLSSTTTYNYINHQLSSITDPKQFTSNITYLGNKVSELIDAASKKTKIYYDSSEHTRVVSPKAFDTTPAQEAAYTSDYYLSANPYFRTGLVTKSVGPTVKNEQNIDIRQTTEYDYNDDFLTQGVTDPSGALSTTAYDDISGNLINQFNANNILTTKNTYNYATYETGRWNMLDTYNGNGVQTIFSYDANGNILEKSSFDGDQINLLHNPNLESYSRTDQTYVPGCSSGKVKVQVPDYWCGWGSGLTSGTRSYNIDQINKDDGNQSQSISLTLPAGKTGSVNIFQIIDDSTRTQPNTTYTLTFRYKQTGSDLLKTQSVIYNDDASPAATTIGPPVSGPLLTSINSWSTYQTSFTTPTSNGWWPFWTSEIFLTLRLPLAAITDVSGTLWIDNIRLQQGSTGTTTTQKTFKSEYYPSGLVKKETTPEGKIVNYEWNNDGTLKSATDPLGNRTEFTYDANGNKLSSTEPKGVATNTDINDYKTLFNYNNQSQITSVTEAATGNKTTYTYDVNNNIQDTITPNGLKTTIMYDQLNRAQNTINPYGFSSKVEYDANGNPKGIIDPNKKNSTITYDASNKVTQKTESSGQTTETKYNANDQVKVLSVESQTLTYNYDKNGRPIGETFNNNGIANSTSYTYDKANNIIQTTTPNNDIITPSYTTTNEISKISIGGTTAKYTRNKNNQLTRLDKQVDANGNPTGDSITYQYNDAGQVTDIIHSKNGTNFQTYHYEFDANGNRKQVTINGQTTTYEYDNLNQISKTTTQDSKITQYSYDKGGNILEITYPDLKKDVFFYEGNRLVKKINKLGISEYIGYDANGNITSRDNGESIPLLSRFENNLSNDRDHQAALINDDKTTPTYAAGKFGQALKLANNQYLSYSSSSNLNKAIGTIEFWFQPNWSADNQARTLFEYYADAKNYIRIQKTTDNKIQFNYVSNGKDYGSTSSAVNFQANNWYHLATTWSPTQSATYLNGSKIGEKVYCAPGAWTCGTTFTKIATNATKIILGASVITTANQFADITLDELQISGISKTAQDITKDYQSTQSSSLIKTTTYEYDSDDYLNKISKPDGSILTYTYDANKRLIKKKTEGVNPAETTYLYDGDKVVSETTGTDITKYLYDTAGSLLIIAKNNNNYYPVYDGLGSIIGIRDSAGNTINSYNYDDWGTVTSKTEGIQNTLRFSDYKWDQEANMYLLGSRWYDPTLVRFVSVDPYPGNKEESLSLNEYIYCHNNPVNYFDPQGDKRKKIDKKFHLPSLSDWLINHGYGDAILYMNQNSSFWRYAMDHPFITGLGVGVGGGICFAGGSLALGGTVTFNGNSYGVHILWRMIQRGVSPQLIQKTIAQGTTFKYLHEGIIKTGYYNAASKIMVATYNNKILTVMTNVTPKYISRLLKK